MGSNDDDATSFKFSLQQSLLDPIIVEKYQKIFSPMLKPISDALEASNLLVDHLRKQLKANDEEVAALRDDVDALKFRYDDLEQHGRRGSMRVFGDPEHTTGTVDHKVLSLVNEHLKVTPPLVLEDIEVAHRLCYLTTCHVIMDNCPVCDKKILQHARKIICCICN